MQRARAWLIRLWAATVLLINRLYFHYAVRISNRAKCPACGSRKSHQFVWSPAYEVVMHTCEDCHGVWGERPVVGVQHWRVSPIQVPATPDAEGPRAPFGASREPVMISHRKAVA
jgi:hypothetical protein